MQKLIINIFILFILSISFAFAEDNINYIYTPSTKSWKKFSDNTNLCKDELKVTKTPIGKCFGFDFYNQQGEKVKSLVGSCGTTYLNNRNMYSFSFTDLKLSKFNNNEFKELSIEEIQKLYPYVQIIKTSDFKNGELGIVQTKSVQKYWLISDNDYSAYNYDIYGVEFDLKRDKNLAIFTIDKENAIVQHSFWGECNTNKPCLTMRFSKKRSE